MQRVHRIDRAEQARALLVPIRARLLRLLVEPTSAASLARRLGETAPKIHYHLKELERLRLVRQAGQKRRGNLVETLFEARASWFYVPQHIFTLAAEGEPRGTEDGPAPGGVLALQARVALKTADARRSFARDWRRLVEKYAPRDGTRSADALFEAIALCVPAPIEPPPRARSGPRSGSRTKGEQIA